MHPHPAPYQPCSLTLLVFSQLAERSGCQEISGFSEISGSPHSPLQPKEMQHLCGGQSPSLLPSFPPPDPKGLR